ncbi:AP3-complex subunit beta-A-like [Pyrus ussuriensis x Pyrus communis]|uniref:AP3-complex subunit beta-A-like n=1 Tax=Pyrus ussuriensis x Pyrus communis TaxID=2448454 RepID=A0A5N5F4M6_9ROSA|nr:AP3-complex subunit beta-A-like [Pyrus ussuriensis x Pyrus communis]
MAGIRLHVIAPLVLVAAGKCARDPSVYVRKCADSVLPKLHDLRLEENTVGIEEIIGILLNDSSPCVVGAAAAAFSSVCPNNLSLVGRNYKRLREVLPDVEEWGKIVLIGILLRYVVARHGLVKESIMFSLHGTWNHRSEKDCSDTNSALDDNGNNRSL